MKSKMSFACYHLYGQILVYKDRFVIDENGMIFGATEHTQNWIWWGNIDSNWLGKYIINRR